MRRLVVNADDFGFTRDVNRGILEAHRNGILTATTLMANGAAFDDAVRLAAAAPALDVGVHFVLIGGRSLLPPFEAFPLTVNALLLRLAAGRLRVYDELRAQLEKIVSAGIRPSHFDTHKHTHLLPQVLDALARLAREFGVKWVRRPFPVPLLGGLYLDKLRRHGCRTTDHFTGFRLTGKFDASDVLRVIATLGDGSTEFMTHPGFCTAELQAARTRLKASREAELRALTDPRLRPALAAAGVELTNYSAL